MQGPPCDMGDRTKRLVACLLSGLHIPVICSPNVAVEGFMLLSGFLMTYHYLLRQAQEPWDQPTTWGAFWIRRYFRITPLYTLVLIPAFVLMRQYIFWRSQIDQFNGVALRFVSEPPLDLRNVLYHLTYVFGLLPQYSSSLVIPDWSLSLEMQFYFVFPFLMLLAARLGWVWFPVINTAIWGAAHWADLGNKFSQPSPLYLSILWFAIGMLWASPFHLQNKRIRFALFGCVLAVLSLKTNSILLVFVFAAIMFLQNPLMQYARNLLSNKICVFLAEASYSVYLIHLLILTPTIFMLATRTHLSRPLISLLSVSITVLVSYSLAKPLKTIENIGHTFGKKLAKRILKRRTPHAVTIAI